MRTNSTQFLNRDEINPDGQEDNEWEENWIN